jgi:hypothetical protein
MANQDFGEVVNLMPVESTEHSPEGTIIGIPVGSPLPNCRPGFVWEHIETTQEGIYKFILCKNGGVCELPSESEFIYETQENSAEKNVTLVRNNEPVISPMEEPSRRIHHFVAPYSRPRFQRMNVGNIHAAVQNAVSLRPRQYFRPTSTGDVQTSQNVELNFLSNLSAYGDSSNTQLKIFESLYKKNEFDISTRLRNSLFENSRLMDGWISVIDRMDNHSKVKHVKKN